MRATVKTSDNHMGLPSRSNPNPTVNAWKNKAFAVFADQASIFYWHPHLSPHADPPRYFNVPLRHSGVFVNYFPSEAKKIVNTLKGSLF